MKVRSQLIRLFALITLTACGPDQAEQTETAGGQDSISRKSVKVRGQENKGRLVNPITPEKFNLAMIGDKLPDWVSFYQDHIPNFSLAHFKKYNPGLKTA